MKIMLDLQSIKCDDERIEYLDDFENAMLEIFVDPVAFTDECETTFSISMTYGNDLANSIYSNVTMIDMELFAHSILKCIEMLKRDYAEAIKDKMDKGFVV